MKWVYYLEIKCLKIFNPTFHKRSIVSFPDCFTVHAYQIRSNCVQIVFCAGIWTIWTLWPKKKHNIQLIQHCFQLQISTFSNSIWILWTQIEKNKMDHMSCKAWNDNTPSKLRETSNVVHKSRYEIYERIKIGIRKKKTSLRGCLFPSSFPEICSNGCQNKSESSVHVFLKCGM